MIFVYVYIYIYYIYTPKVVKQLRIQCNLTNHLKLVNEGYQNANQNNSWNCCIACFSLSSVSSASQKSVELRVSKRGVRRHMLQWNKLPCWRWGPAHRFVMSSSWR